MIDESDGLRAMRQSVETIEAELRNIHDEPMIGFLVVWDGRLWLRKPNGTWPEVLGCRLGQSWLNVAETVAGSEASGATDLNGAPIETAGGPPLVRVGQTSAVDGLPIRDLDEAIASELAFSLWTRRRDAGAWNRVYLEGVPVFFDHHIAFGTEDDHRSLDGFFKRGSNGGYARQWRLKRLENGEVPTTWSISREEAREIIDNTSAHYHESTACIGSEAPTNSNVTWIVPSKRSRASATPSCERQFPSRTHPLGSLPY